MTTLSKPVKVRKCSLCNVSSAVLQYQKNRLHFSSRYIWVQRRMLLFSFRNTCLYRDAL